jgi:hypothetical protein
MKVKSKECPPDKLYMSEKNITKKGGGFLVPVYEGNECQHSWRVIVRKDELYMSKKTDAKDFFFDII